MTNCHRIKRAVAGSLLAVSFLGSVPAYAGLAATGGGLWHSVLWHSVPLCRALLWMRPLPLCLDGLYPVDAGGNLFGPGGHPLDHCEVSIVEDEGLTTVISCLDGKP